MPDAPEPSSPEPSSVGGVTIMSGSPQIESRRSTAVTHWGVARMGNGGQIRSTSSFKKSQYVSNGGLKVTHSGFQ